MIDIFSNFIFFFLFLVISSWVSCPSRHPRLSALDAGFLALEGPDTPMHVGSVILFEGAPLRDRRGRIRVAPMRELIEARLDLVPRYRQIPASGPLGAGRPFWVDDACFDIAHHVMVTTVGPPAAGASCWSWRASCTPSCSTAPVRCGSCGWSTAWPTGGWG